ncbi:hypothetical protein HGM15179_015905 [Zosterops borbonicus]|uniref:Uncharacterized protein n=1 Tax=Zosterops borbonicus TaxID=364589 RepID=A0A8K1G3L3_9PASS|nr:hypothetical protein HGM15179_015905 [Zosterops borbonicus]
MSNRHATEHTNEDQNQIEINDIIRLWDSSKGIDGSADIMEAVSTLRPQTGGCNGPIIRHPGRMIGPG